MYMHVYNIVNVELMWVVLRKPLRRWSEKEHGTALMTLEQGFL